MVNGDVEWTSGFYFESDFDNEARGNGTYRFRVIHPDAPHGGIVLVTFHAPGQSDHTAAYYLRDLPYGDVSTFGQIVREALTELRHAQYQKEADTERLTPQVQY